MEEVLGLETNSMDFFPRPAIFTPAVTFDMPLCSLDLSFYVNLQENLSKCFPKF